LRASLKGVRQFLSDASLSLEYAIKRTEVFTPEEHKMQYQLVKPDWVGDNGAIFTMDKQVWADAQTWALRHKLITVGADPASYFSNDYIPSN
jgi:hypothetical protein